MGLRRLPKTFSDGVGLGQPKRELRNRSYLKLTHVQTRVVAIDHEASQCA